MAEWPSGTRIHRPCRPARVQVGTSGTRPDARHCRRACAGASATRCRASHAGARTGSRCARTPFRVTGFRGAYAGRGHRRGPCNSTCRSADASAHFRAGRYARACSSANAPGCHRACFRTRAGAGRRCAWSGAGRCCTRSNANDERTGPGACSRAKLRASASGYGNSRSRPCADAGDRRDTRSSSRCRQNGCGGNGGCTGFVDRASGRAGRNIDGSCRA